MIETVHPNVTPPTARGLVRLELPGGRRVETLCPENTLIAHEEIFDLRIYEMFGIELADGATVFDVGANIGLAVLWVGDRIGRGTVHAFEPIPSTFAALERNVGGHPHLDIHLHHAGAGNHDGTATFTFYPKTSTSSTMYPDHSLEARAESNRFILADIQRRLGVGFKLVPGWVARSCAEGIRRWYQRSETVTCRLVRLSDVIREEGIGQIDLLKVDVEGAEFDALEGIDAADWPRISQAIVEVHEGKEACTRMERLFADRGFLTTAWQQSPDVFARHWLVYARRPADPSTASTVSS
jgi:FkbM family methyltransferase